MARTPVSWDPNRYGAVRYEYKLDSTTGNYSMVEKEHDYTGVNYNFTPLVTTPPVTIQPVPGPQPTTPITAPKLPKSPLFADDDPYKADFSRDTGQDAYDEALGKRQYWDKQGEEWGPQLKSTTEGAWDRGKWGPGPKTEERYWKEGEKWGPQGSENFFLTGTEEDAEGKTASAIKTKYAWDDKSKDTMTSGAATTRYKGGDNKVKTSEPWEVNPFELSGHRRGIQETGILSKTPDSSYDDEYVKDAEDRFANTFELPGHRRGIQTPETDIAKRYRTLSDKELKTFKSDQWVKDIYTSPKDPSFTGWILKSEANRFEREQKARLDKLRKVPFIGSRLAVADEFLSKFKPKLTETQQLNKRHFTAYTSGSMAGRITGADGKYNPSENLYHGMNRNSAYGNLERAGAKRIATREATIARRAKTDRPMSQKFINDTNNMKGEQKDYKEKKKKGRVKKAVDRGASIDNPNEMRNVGGGNGKGSDSGKSIICTQMYQQTQLEDWKKTMQLWYIFQKKYLTIEHQQGYHFLFKPFVNGMKKSKVLTTLGKHCAIARTNDIKHIMFGTSFSLSGRLVRLVTEPICYITGKIKSWL